MSHYDDLKTGAIAYAAFVSTIILLVVILLVRALCYGLIEAEESKKLTTASYVTADEEISRQKSQVASFAKIQVPAATDKAASDKAASDKAAPDKAVAAPEAQDQFHIPVTRAAQLLLKEWNATEADPKK